MQKLSSTERTGVRRSTTVPHSDESSRESLLTAAKRLFAEKGFDATTVREISEAAGVNISLVSYYFNGKEGLFRTCLEKFGMARLAAAQRLLQPPKSSEELRVRLEMFIDEFFQSYLEEPDVTRIIHRECDLNYGVTEDIFRETFLKVFETLVGFVKAAQKAGLISKELEADSTSSILFGAVVHFTRIDLLNQKYLGHSLSDQKYRNKLSDHLIRIMLHGIRTEKKES